MVYKEYRKESNLKSRPEPKTRVCIACRIRQVVANMEKVEKVWYCQDCAAQVTGSVKWTAPQFDYEKSIDE